MSSHDDGDYSSHSNSNNSGSGDDSGAEPENIGNVPNVPHGLYSQDGDESELAFDAQGGQGAGEDVDLEDEEEKERQRELDQHVHDFLGAGLLPLPATEDNFPLSAPSSAVANGAEGVQGPDSAPEFAEQHPSSRANETREAYDAHFKMWACRSKS